MHSLPCLCLSRTGPGLSSLATRDTSNSGHTTKNKTKNCGVSATSGGSGRKHRRVPVRLRPRQSREKRVDQKQVSGRNPGCCWQASTASTHRAICIRTCSSLLLYSPVESGFEGSDWGIGTLSRCWNQHLLGSHLLRSRCFIVDLVLLCRRPCSESTGLDRTSFVP